MKNKQWQNGIPGQWTIVALVSMVVIILTISSLGAVTGPAPSSPSASGTLTTSGAPAPPMLSISDGQTIAINSPKHATLQDQIFFSIPTASSRTYTIQLKASVPLKSVLVTIVTYPISQWGLPNQLPGGADSLPVLALWNWSIEDLGVNVTSEWKSVTWNQQLSGVTTWANQTIVIQGTTTPRTTVTVTPTSLDGTYAPAIGFVVNTPGVAGGIPTNDSSFGATAAALEPGIVRFSTTTAAVMYSWNTETNQPAWNFSYFDSLVSFSRSTGGGILLTLPAGTWGDGNTLPLHMPVNMSVAVPGPLGLGYFPGNAAYVAYVEGIVNHTIASGEHIAYWTIGNEFPTQSLALVMAYTNLFNLAEKTIHLKLPTALVGSDVMTNTTYESYFATHAQNVGFLSFHLYPSAGLCVVHGSYCAPKGAPLGSTDEGILSHSAYEFLANDYAPKTAQSMWFNMTRHWVPIFDAESNLNGVGGSISNAAVGTDPRTQTLFGASWVTSLLIDSAFQNVSDVTYFDLSSGWETPNTLTSQYGGWGYGLTSENAAHTSTLYAPYYALKLWANAFPAHAPGVMAESSSPSTIHTYAALDGSSLSIVLESRVAVPVSVSLVVADSRYTLESVTTLDQAGYNMVYEPWLDSTVLKSDNLQFTNSPTPTAVTITGYGVAVAKYVLTEGSGDQPTAGTHASPRTPVGKLDGTHALGLNAQIGTYAQLPVPRAPSTLQTRVLSTSKGHLALAPLGQGGKA
jgi:hypothetical protein